jgi:hypothetical protein
MLQYKIRPLLFKVHQGTGNDEYANGAGSDASGPAGIFPLHTFERTR